MLQGIKQISVQSSVSLQHLPYDVALETSLPKEIEGKLSFATQKLHEIVKAKTPASNAKSLTQALPAVGEPTPAANSPMKPSRLPTSWQHDIVLHILNWTHQLLLCPQQSASYLLLHCMVRLLKP